MTNPAVIGEFHLDEDQSRERTRHEQVRARYLKALEVAMKDRVASGFKAQHAFLRGQVVRNQGDIDEYKSQLKYKLRLPNELNPLNASSTQRTSDLRIHRKIQQYWRYQLKDAFYRVKTARKVLHELEEAASSKGQLTLMDCAKRHRNSVDSGEVVETLKPGSKPYKILKIAVQDDPEPATEPMEIANLE